MDAFVGLGVGVVVFVRFVMHVFIRLGVVCVSLFSSCMCLFGLVVVVFVNGRRDSGRHSATC